ncbi:MAG TPA: glycosyltransferase family 4 protein [Gaiellaceae bacterium]|nr:glycosyltransferase family 4 protein [Gaiellaceae bacterium]
MRVAYFSPLPPERSGVADYSALLLPALQERMDVTVVRRGAKKPPRGTDVALYHVGNNPEAHGWIVDALRRRSGIVVLHDFVVHHLIAGTTLGRGHSEAYLDAMQRDGGVLGRLLAHGVVDNLLPPIWEERAQDFPLTREVLDQAAGVICHSRYVERLVREYGYEGQISVIPMAAWPSVELGERLVPEGRSPVIVCVGYLNAGKRVPQLLAAFEQFRTRFPNALLVLAGTAASDVRIDAESLGEGVLRLDHLDEADLWRLLDDCDVCVSLRWPTMGETSGMAIRALSLGTPLVVSDVGWFSELPDSVAIKVPVDEHEVRTLTAALEQLGGDEALRREMSAAATGYARREHDLGRVADLYVAAIEEMAGGPSVRQAVLSDVARAAHDVGIDKNDAQLSEIAASVREVGLGN